jgi:hypothetical protein
MKAYKEDFDNFIILFYTDGIANYPEKEIRELNSCGISFKFYGYCESAAEAVFKIMC